MKPIDQNVEKYDLLMGVTDMTQERRTVGRVALVPNLHNNAMISMDLIKLIPNEGSTLFYYAMICYGGYSELLSRFANGTNVSHLRVEILDLIDVIIPSNELQNRYVNYLKDMQDKINILQDQIMFAGEARKRLLPQLMSGAIKV